MCRVYFFIFLLNFLLSIFSSPKALRLECWQQICYSVHQITSSRWWRIKDSEREMKLDYFPERLANMNRFRQSILILSFLFLTVEKKEPFQPDKKMFWEVQQLCFTVWLQQDFLVGRKCGPAVPGLLRVSSSLLLLPSSVGRLSNPKPTSRRPLSRAGAPRDAKEFISTDLAPPT